MAVGLGVDWMPPPERGSFRPEEFPILVHDHLGELLSDADSAALHSVMAIEDMDQAPLEFLAQRQDPRIFSTASGGRSSASRFGLVGDE